MDNSGHIYVAVVDDDENLCRSFARLLRAAGMRPITYASAEAFLADKKRPRFDCLVLDIQLTGMSGLELQKQTRGHGHDRPRYLHHRACPQARAQAHAAGCAGYFRKTDSWPLHRRLGNDASTLFPRP